MMCPSKVEMMMSSFYFGIPYTLGWTHPTSNKSFVISWKNGSRHPESYKLWPRGNIRQSSIREPLWEGSRSGILLLGRPNFFLIVMFVIVAMLILVAMSWELGWGRCFRHSDVAYNVVVMEPSVKSRKISIGMVLSASSGAALVPVEPLRHEVAKRVDSTTTSTNHSRFENESKHTPPKTPPDGVFR